MHLPRLEDLPKTADGGYEPTSVVEAFEVFARFAASTRAELRVSRAAASRQPSTAPSRETIAAGVAAERIVRAAADYADQLELASRAEADEIVREAREQGRAIVERAHEVTRELLRAASFGEAHLEELVRALVRAASASE
ncbi:MAG TPA: hypothetical protein VFW85_01830 [Gaiellaceae bacterium]|nr:hypothetical protein [Gaiellaceae bacterium]